MSDPTKEKSVSACGLSRRRNRRISPDQRQKMRDAAAFPPMQTGMSDGETGYDNTPANRLKGEGVRQLPPPGFPGAGSTADAEATAPQSTVETFRELVKELKAAEIKPDENGMITLDVPTGLTHPALQTVDNPAGVRGGNDYNAIKKWTFENLDKIDAIIAEGEAGPDLAADLQEMSDAEVIKEEPSEPQEHSKD